MCQTVISFTLDFYTIKFGNVPWNQTLGSVIPLPPYFFYDLCNRKGCKCRRHEHTASGDHWERRSRSQPYKAPFFVWGEGGNKAVEGLSSREIIKKWYYTKCAIKRQKGLTCRSVFVSIQKIEKKCNKFGANLAAKF